MITDDREDCFDHNLYFVQLFALCSTPTIPNNANFGSNGVMRGSRLELEMGPWSYFPCENAPNLIISLIAN